MISSNLWMTVKCVSLAWEKNTLRSGQFLRRTKPGINTCRSGRTYAPLSKEKVSYTTIQSISSMWAGAAAKWCAETPNLVIAFLLVI